MIVYSTRQQPRRSRPEWLAIVTPLRESGLTYAAIARELGISGSFVQSLISDPSGDKLFARRQKYKTPCPRCGTLMCGSSTKNGKSASEYCWNCVGAVLHEERIWTGEAIIDCFLAFKLETGRNPTAADSNRAPTMLRRMSPERQAEIMSAPRLPHPDAVYREFGSWSAGLLAAGLPASPAGGQPAHRTGFHRTRARSETVALLANGPMSITELAKARSVVPGSARSVITHLITRGIVETCGLDMARRGRGTRPSLYRLRAN